MNGLDGIGVQVVTRDADDASEANAWALLHELDGMLDALLQDGEESSIDLRSIPMTTADREVLARVLGEGELNASIDALGPSRVRETGIHGVWWVTHHNTDDAVIAEFLEVSFCPDILRSHIDDVRDTLESLRTQLVQHRES
ncbi:MAG: hydrogenase expression/formation C-terminal domain-containing protein [Gammaproteobacteria bacterium]